MPGPVFADGGLGGYGLPGREQVRVEEPESGRQRAATATADAVAGVDQAPPEHGDEAADLLQSRAPVPVGSL